MVLESSDQIGGKVLAFTHDGLHHELGLNVYTTEYTEFLRLAREYGYSTAVPISNVVAWRTPGEFVSIAPRVFRQVHRGLPWYARLTGNLGSVFSLLTALEALPRAARADSWPRTRRDDPTQAVGCSEAAPESALPQLPDKPRPAEHRPGVLPDDDALRLRIPGNHPDLLRAAVEYAGVLTDPCGPGFCCPANSWVAMVFTAGMQTLLEVVRRDGIEVRLRHQVVSVERGRGVMVTARDLSNSDSPLVRLEVDDLVVACPAAGVELPHGHLQRSSSASPGCAARPTRSPCTSPHRNPRGTPTPETSTRKRSRQMRSYAFTRSPTRRGSWKGLPTAAIRVASGLPHLPDWGGRRRGRGGPVVRGADDCGGGGGGGSTRRRFDYFWRYEFRGDRRRSALAKQAALQGVSTYYIG